MAESGFLMNAQKNIAGGVPTLTDELLLQLKQLPLIPPPTWNKLNLLNSWVNKSGLYGAYRKYSNGIVEVRFWLTKATAPTLGETLFNLPSGHRPKEDYQFSAVMTDSKKAYILGHLNIGADGNVGFFSNKMDANTEVRGRLIFGVD